MRKLTLMSASLLSALTLATAVAPASYAQQSRKDGYYDSNHKWHPTSRRAKEQCEKERQKASNKSAIIGGLLGAAVGGTVSGKGAKTEGAVVGGVGGALAGRQLSNKKNRC
jgi:hypothetical protein